MSPTHPVLLAFWVTGLALVGLALLGKVTVPIFGEVGTNKYSLRSGFGSVGLAVVVLAAHITFSPAAAAWFLMEEGVAGYNIGGDGDRSEVASESQEACRRACSGAPLCDAWTFQPGYDGGQGISCFLWREQGVSLRIEKMDGVWTGRKRVFARALDGVWPCV